MRSFRSRLLVSVSSLSEAWTAWKAGADIIDLKDPERGSLGPCEPRVVDEVVDTLGASVSISLAAGDLDTATLSWIQRCWRPSIRYLKIGFAGWRDRDWSEGWRTLLVSAPKGVCLVPVVYADAAAADAPTLAEIQHHLPHSTLLIDTYRKDGRTLLAHLAEEQLRESIAEYRRQDKTLALAGSLGLAEAARLASWQADIIGVRGAACQGGRFGTIDASKIRLLRNAIDAL